MISGSHSAFLLTSRWHDEGETTLLTYWWQTPRGPVRTVITQPVVCFIPAVAAERAQNAATTLGWPVTVRTVPMRSFDGEAAAACYLPSGLLYRWRDLMREQGVVCREVDIRPTDRYLMERFVYGAAELHGHWRQGTHFADIEGVRITPTRYQPSLRCVSIDIETSFPRNGEPDRLFSIACYQPHESLVLMIGDPDQSNDEVTLVADEPALLRAFLTYIQACDPDVLIGWNVIQFDMDFLRRKYHQHGIAFTLGRDGSELQWRVPANQPDRIYLHIPGRVVMDGIECMRNATYQFESFALNDVAEHFLGDGKLLHGDDRGGDIERLFIDDKPALARYNLKDCELVWRIFEKADLFNFMIERAHMTGLPLDRMGGSVAAFENMYLPRLHRAGYVAPNLGEGYSAEKSPGGYVMDSRPGLFEHVLVLDFKSLYPSIIRTFKVDPMGLVEGLAAYEAGGATKETVVPGYFAAQFHQQRHILPDLIRHLGERRDLAKQQGNRALSQAIKVIMASCYGVLGSDGCRFYDTRLSASITKRSHDIIQQSSRWIAQQGYDVIYGDTDSVFVWLKKSVTNDEADVIGKQLVRDLNVWFKQELQAQWGVESHLEMEYETHYRRFFMPSIRGEETGSKKRYAGLIETAGTAEMVFKGLEAVRTDWTPLARQFQRELYRRVFFAEPYEDWLREQVNALLTGQRDDLLIYRKRLRRPLPLYQKNRPPHARAASLLDAWREQQGLKPRFSDRGGWISYKITINGPEPVEIQRSLVDYGHYLEKQLAPIADAIFQFTGDDFLRIAGQQLDLF